MASENEIKKREFLAPSISPVMMWVAGIIFAAGCAYTFVMRIPAIEKEQYAQCLKINTMEANYVNIEKWMEKIDRKLDRRDR